MVHTKVAFPAMFALMLLCRGNNARFIDNPVPSALFPCSAFIFVHLAFTKDLKKDKKDLTQTESASACILHSH